jgi:uncharacterized protein YdaU (DUF1376 family)
MSLPYFPMYPTDFEADTSHLTLAEDGAYNRLLRLMWMTSGCTLPADDAWIKRRMRVDQDTFDGVVKVVIDEFFTVDSGRLSNAKLGRIFAETNEAHKKRVSAGSKGGKAKALKTNKPTSSNAVAKPKQPEPEPEPDKGEPKGSLCGFDEFWKIWPDKTGKENARKAWKKLTMGNRRQAFSAIRDGWFYRWQQSKPDANPIHASTFLNSKRWTDEFHPQLKAINGGQAGNTSQRIVGTAAAGTTNQEWG